MGKYFRFLLFLVVFLELNSTVAQAGPISWEMGIFETTKVNFKELKPIFSNIGAVTKIVHAKEKLLGVECFYKVQSAWIEKGTYVESLSFFCKDKKSGNIFDYGSIVQCDNQQLRFGSASPAIYKSENKMLNIVIQCRLSQSS